MTMTDRQMRMTMILGDAEATALRTYAEREGITVKAAAHKLITEALERRMTQQRCSHCDGRGWS